MCSREMSGYVSKRANISIGVFFDMCWDSLCCFGTIRDHLGERIDVDTSIHSLV